MAADSFEFELYRLNIIDKVDLFTLHRAVIRGDSDIEALLRHASQPRFDQTTPGTVGSYRWSLRGLAEGGTTERPLLSVTLARSALSQHGRVVTDSEILEGVFDTEPPMAVTMALLFDLKRHLVAVERTSQLIRSNTWRKVVEATLAIAAEDLEFGSTLALEPRPEHNEIIEAFHSFEKLTRLRVHLRLPNPEITRITKHLYDDLRNGGIREYLQDMKNPGGLSKTEGALPFASASMAQQGYKKKDVVMEGFQDGRFTRVVTGRNAARGNVGQLRDFVRGLAKTAQTKEGARIVAAVTEEIDRIAPQTDDAA